MKTVKLGDVCLKITDGSHYSPKADPGGEYPYVTVRDVQDDIINFESCKLIDESQYQDLVKNGCKPENGDLLFSKDGTVGKVSLVSYDKEFVVLSSLAIIRPDRNILDPEYLFHILKSPKFLEAAIGRKSGTAIRRIILRDLKNIEITIHESLAEQRRVVERLDGIFAKIDRASALLEENIANTNALKQSLLAQAFDVDSATHTHRLATLGEICSILGGKRLPRGEKLLKEQTLFPYIRVTDFDGKGGIDIANIKYVSEKVHKLIHRYIVKSSDVFLSIAGTIGVTGVVSDELDGANLTENACRLVPSNELNRDYLYFFTLSDSFKMQSMAGVRQSAQPKLALTRIRDIIIRLPSVNKQEDVVRGLKSKFSQIDLVLKQYKVKLAKVQALKQSLLTEAFSVQ